MLRNILPREELRSLAGRRAKPDEYKSVRNQLVAEEIGKGWAAAKKSGKTTTRLKRQKSLDRLLEDRVWVLLYRMGFAHLSGQGGAFQGLAEGKEGQPESQIDVVAIDAEAAVVVECKSSASPRKFGDFSAVLAKHVALRKGFGRSLQAQFPTAKKHGLVFVIWTAGIVPTDSDRSRAQAEKVCLLDEKDLDYYETLINQIGAAARYQFLADLLQGQAIPGLEITVPAIRTRMGSFDAYVFSVSPEYLLKIAFVSHRKRGKATDI
ncbi:MAG: hypothetical protein EPN53_03070, partial [Acidobacteria bacterium]